ncbi:hypothetical protein ES703_17937 [subsurface metagenome]
MSNQSKEKVELKKELDVLNKERRRLNRELSTLKLIISEINSTLNLNRVLDLIIQKGIQIVEAERGSLMLFDHRKEELYIKSSVGLNKRTVSAVRIAPGEGIAGWVFKEGKPLLIKKGAKDPRFKKFEEEEEELKSVISVPLKIKNKVIGVINADDKREGDFFSIDDLNLFSTFANQAAIAIQNAQLHQEVKQQAITDGFKHYLALIMADIDDFKNFNDTYGHPEGNKVLKSLANILRSNIREVDIVARYGGEEFIVILPEANREEAKKIAERIRSKVEKCNFADKKNHPERKITISLGITSCFQENITPQGLVQKVDQALYQAKRKGRNRVEVI